MTANELCPHCVAVPMVARTNYMGGVYLECLDCGYYDAVRRRPAQPSRRLRKRSCVPRLPRPRKNIHGTLHTVESGLAKLRTFVQTHGRAPVRREFGGTTGMPSDGWFRSHFGSVSDALALVGWTPKRRGRPALKEVA